MVTSGNQPRNHPHLPSHLFRDFDPGRKPQNADAGASWMRKRKDDTNFSSGQVPTTLASVLGDLGLAGPPAAHPFSSMPVGQVSFRVMYFRLPGFHDLTSLVPGFCQLGMAPATRPSACGLSRSPHSDGADKTDLVLDGRPLLAKSCCTLLVCFIPALMTCLRSLLVRGSSEAPLCINEGKKSMASFILNRTEWSPLTAIEVTGPSTGGASQLVTNLSYVRYTALTVRGDDCPHRRFVLIGSSDVVFSWTKPRFNRGMNRQPNPVDVCRTTKPRRIYPSIWVVQRGVQGHRCKSHR